MLTQMELDLLGHDERSLSKLLDEVPPVQAKYKTGTRSADKYLQYYGAFFADRFGLTLVPGSFNLYANYEVKLPNPLTTSNNFAPEEWSTAYISPVVVKAHGSGQVRPASLGFIMRFEKDQNSPFIEVFAHTRLKDHLNMIPGGEADVWILPSRESHSGLI